MELLTFFKAWGYLIVFILQIGLTTAVMYLSTKFAPKSLEEEIEDVERRVTAIETTLSYLPSKEEFHKLDNNMCELKGDLKRVDESLKGVRMVHELLQDQANRIDEFLRRNT